MLRHFPACSHGLEPVEKERRFQICHTGEPRNTFVLAVRRDGEIFTQRALVDVLVTGRSHVSRRTRAQVSPCDGVGVTVGALSAGVADAGIVQLAQQSCPTAQTEHLSDRKTKTLTEVSVAAY